MREIPHLRVMVALSFVILLCFVGVSSYVLGFTSDETMKGSIIQTWNNLAIAVGAFWLGSSVGGKLAHNVADGTRTVTETSEIDSRGSTTPVARTVSVSRAEGVRETAGLDREPSGNDRPIE